MFPAWTEPEEAAPHAEDSHKKPHVQEGRVSLGLYGLVWTVNVVSLSLYQLHWKVYGIFIRITHLVSELTKAWVSVS